MEHIEEQVIAETDMSDRQSRTKLFLLTLWSVLLLIIAGLIYSQIQRDDVLLIKNVQFSGDFQQLSGQQLQDVLKQGINGNFFTLDVNELYKNLYQLPWVDKVGIHRIWPDRLNINIVEQRPYAILKGKGLMNREGVVFTSMLGHFENELPVFNVARRYQRNAINAYSDFFRLLLANDLQVEQFKYDSRKSQTLVLANGIILKLGRKEAKKRLARFIRVFQSQLQARASQIEIVDLRYTNGFAVHWKKTASIITKNKRIA